MSFFPHRSYAKDNNFFPSSACRQIYACGLIGIFFRNAVPSLTPSIKRFSRLVYGVRLVSFPSPSSISCTLSSCSSNPQSCISISRSFDRRCLFSHGSNEDPPRPTAPLKHMRVRCLWMIDSSRKDRTMFASRTSNRISRSSSSVALSNTSPRRTALGTKSAAESFPHATLRSRVSRRRFLAVREKDAGGVPLVEDPRVDA